MVDENQTDCVFIHDPVENGLQVNKKDMFPKTRDGNRTFNFQNTLFGVSLVLIEEG